MTVLRCAGIEVEHELPFAAMHQLARPCLQLVERLPAPQAAALRDALGRHPRRPQAARSARPDGDRLTTAQTKNSPAAPRRSGRGR
jgi:hypothetical protein